MGSPLGAGAAGLKLRTFSPLPWIFCAISILKTCPGLVVLEVARPLGVRFRRLNGGSFRLEHSWGPHLLAQEPRALRLPHFPRGRGCSVQSAS